MRTISAELYEHLQGETTTTCRLLKIRLQNGTQFGITTLDRDVVYRSVTYYSAYGFDPSDIATNTGLSVDNSEARALLTADVEGITSEMVSAGQLDNAAWEMLLVNWADLTMGHVILDAGDIGEVKTVDDIIYIPELISYAMRLRQSIGGVWSRRCRAIFATDANSQTGCGVDDSAMWSSGEVDGIGTDPYRVFADSTLLLTPAPVPGRLRWMTGNNTSDRLYQIEAYSSGSGTIATIEPMPFPVEVGDTFQIRADCSKVAAACTAFSNLVNFKGEPFIPVADGLESMTPGAQIFGGFSGSNIED